ncbi:MAG TPA: UDP-N-acetylmuramoyl-L-alanine--D-glutamate ligase, partial [Oscillospiraceae bacterium]|nr:UDP-N-acetylmuramoyl-L-alanine--D-glutamate ligase [Oscillospiraceae bacterium]
MYQKLIDYFEKPNILILGFGREGRSSFDFIRKHYPQKTLTIADQKAQESPDEFTKVIWGENYLDSLGDFDLVIKSPGIPFKGVRIPSGPEISCQNDLFLRFVECPVIGVTGTKGKSTTSSLIYEMLKAGGIDAC